MENIKQMVKRHTREIDNLQKLCKHIKKSEWIFNEWAPGHFGGKVKVCKWCGKIIERMPIKGQESITTTNSETIYAELT